MSELKPALVKKYRRLIGNYHVELENLMRTLEALENAGLKLAFTVKQVTKVHDRLERYLERIEASLFNAHDVSTIAALLNEQLLGRYDSESAFERTTGQAITQMDKTNRRWEQLHDFVFREDTGPDDDDDIPELSEAELAAITEEAYRESEE